MQTVRANESLLYPGQILAIRGSTGELHDALDLREGGRHDGGRADEDYYKREQQYCVLWDCA
ncbi:hypothetical protein RsS62_66240 [Rhizobium dioscoreae]|uniref:Uncharacterized protein n=1 Tax=Rhizobium dioscoreae TaxID=2653122 RepID=A0ABQ0ZDU7_9HYPH|nr:hypothetical protein RsS62_66240 [Rhizobium dioscoreae]GES53558.1 hypothetical protein RsS93_61720 [Rhizobium dioscoreae]GLU84974.1 hypothetical protein Rhsp01_61500 [Rhizobium sp. NBRC 114257]